MSVGNRDIEKEKYWQKLIKEYSSSGISGSKFCQNRNLKEGQFWYWKAALAKRNELLRRIMKHEKPGPEHPKISQAPLFLPIEVSDEGISGNHLINSADNRQSHFRQQIIVQVFAGTDENTLTAIFQSLEKIGC